MALGVQGQTAAAPLQIKNHSRLKVCHHQTGVIFTEDIKAIVAQRFQLTVNLATAGLSKKTEVLKHLCPLSF